MILPLLRKMIEIRLVYTISGMIGVGGDGNGKEETCCTVHSFDSSSPCFKILI